MIHKTNYCVENNWYNFTRLIIDVLQLLISHLKKVFNIVTSINFYQFSFLKYSISIQKTTISRRMDSSNMINKNKNNCYEVIQLKDSRFLILIKPSCL